MIRAYTLNGGVVWRCRKCGLLVVTDSSAKLIVGGADFYCPEGKQRHYLTYRGMVGTVEIDFESSRLFGKIEFLDDLVTFESDTVEGLQKAFRDSVNDYLETKSSLDKTKTISLEGDNE